MGRKKKRDSGTSNRSSNNITPSPSSSPDNVDTNASAAATTTTTNGHDDDAPPLQQYLIEAQQAALSVEREDYRAAADLYLQSARSAPTPFCDNRYDIFQTYTSILRQESFVEEHLCKQDLKDLQIIADDNDEATIVRAEAAYTAGHLYVAKKHNGEMAADYYRQALGLINSVSFREINMYVTVGVEQKSVEQILTHIKIKTSEQLAKLVNPESNTDGGGARRSATTTRSLNRHAERLSVGGQQCDRCHKTLQELGVTQLNCCSRCGMAYYCSAECQRKQWKAGHKRACRKATQIQVGDLMVLRGLTAKPELNDTLVHIVGPDKAKPERFKVKLDGHENRIISVARDKLFRTRPTM